MGSGVESLADGMFGLLFIMLGAVGDRLDDRPMGGYMCPCYCGVEHRHIMGDYGHISDNRDTGDTSGSSGRSWVGLYVPYQVHHKGRYQGFKGAVRYYRQADRYEQGGEGRGQKDFVFGQYNERYFHKINEKR